MVDDSLALRPMKVKITLLPRRISQEVDVPKGTSVSQLLDQLHLEPGPVVVFKNNVPLSTDSILDNETELTILRVISGG